MKDHYVQAVVELLRDGVAVSDVVKGLERTLTTHRRASLLRPVLERVLVILSASDATTAVAYVAREEDEKALQTEIKAHLATLEATDVPLHVVVDETLIGGSVVRYRDRAIDTSYKHALVELYRSITTQES
jgi:F0F1-type ATP synthase delta subunit